MPGRLVLVGADAILPDGSPGPPPEVLAFGLVARSLGKVWCRAQALGQEHDLAVSSALAELSEGLADVVQRVGPSDGDLEASVGHHGR